MDDEGRIDELERFADVVIRNKHPDSPRGELSHQLANITDRNRINSGEGLVEEHELGLGGKGAGDFHAATLSARERNSRRIPDVVDGELIEQLTQLGFALLPGALGQLQHRANVFLDREAAEDRALLRQITNSQSCPPIHGQMGDLRAVEADPAAVGGNQARDHVEHGRLAGAIGSQKSHSFTAPDGERHIAHHGPPLVGLSQSLDDQPRPRRPGIFPRPRLRTLSPPRRHSWSLPVCHHVFVTRQGSVHQIGLILLKSFTSAGSCPSRGRPSSASGRS